MINSSHDEQPSNYGKNRRRALLAALAGAGIPLGQRVISGQWVAPVVDAVMLPAHAATSQSFPTGSFSSIEVSGNKGPGYSAFENIAERSEEEILDLFVGAAEAANSCDVTYCDANGTVTVDVVATINDNPTSSACLQARVSLPGAASCSASCLIFEFDNVAVNGESVSISESCELGLTDMTVTTEAGLSGKWSYRDENGSLTDNGTFSAPPGAGVCGSLHC